MEFVERVLGITGRRQQRALTEAGVSGDLEEELIGPEYDKFQVAKVSKEDFKKLLQERKPQEILSHIGHVSDTHVYYDLFMDIGQGVKIKTGATQIDYSDEWTLFHDLQEMDYRHHSIEPRHEHGDTKWAVYNLEKEI